jgi:hypothetical protein
MILIPVCAMENSERTSMQLLASVVSLKHRIGEVDRDVCPV